MDNFRHLLTILWYKQKNNTNAVWKKNSYGRCSQACCWLQNIIWTLGKQWLTCWHIKQCMNKWTARWHSRYGSRSIKQKKGACTKMLIVVNSGSLASIFFQLGSLAREQASSGSLLGSTGGGRAGKTRITVVERAGLCNVSILSSLQNS